MATVRLTNVRKVYGKNAPAVDSFSLDIADKEFVVFVGPSGCGKSTTLRMIAGLEDITDGIIEIDGVTVNDLQPKDRDIAMVFQNYALYPHLNVYENMAFSLRLRKMKEDEIYSRVSEAAEILGITDYLLRKPRALSGGQRQRVAIGRAMVRDSKVFLLDEPLSNLDAKLRNQMRSEIILLRQKIDTTFIYVTHDQTEAMTLGDRIVIMKDGLIRQVGTPGDVFDMPADLFVAEFIGAPKMNIIRTHLGRDSGGCFVTPYGVRLPVDGGKGDLLTERGVPERNIILGVRPEHITLTGSDDPCGIHACVRIVEMMGSELHLHLDIDRTGNENENKSENNENNVASETDTDADTVGISRGDTVVRVQTMTLSDTERRSLTAGARVYITFNGKVMHFFDCETGRNLLI